MNYGFGFNGLTENYLEQTVTVFATSGGQSGSGFTGVSAANGNGFARLVTQIGSAPGCVLGSCSDSFSERRGINSCCNGSTLGTIVDIPFNRMAAIVHNTVGGNWY